jgi:uncharacterized Zn finger protein (UPF0148 family)
VSGTAENSSRIKSAAAALLKGGTLVSEQCEKFGGVQVRFADKVTCINCGNESQPGAAAKKEEKAPPAGMGSAAATIEAKISALVQELQNEQDTAVQKQKAELLELYLRILEKMRNLGER